MKHKYSQRAAFAGMLLIASVSGWCYWTSQRSLPFRYHSPLTDPQVAFDELRRGNLRFVHSHRTDSTDTRHDDDVRHLSTRGQHPFAAVLACSDSRVIPGFIFDQRLGTIFDIRNAGNVVDKEVLASLEYAVEHLHVPLVVVLGHRGCGAIEAVCEAGEEPFHDHLQALQAHMQGIRPLVLEV